MALVLDASAVAEYLVASDRGDPDLPARRWPVEPLLGRVWELREDVTAYDATYVALAEALDADLLSTDERLARAIDGRSTCRVVSL